MRSLCVLPVVLVAAGLGAQCAPGSATAQAFAAGGFIRMHLESGSYTIRPTDTEQITVSCHADAERDQNKAKVKIKREGSTAILEVTDTPHNNFQVVVEVPRRTDLRVRMTAGELHVEPIEGDKDLTLRAGELTVEIPHPDEYGRRDASVWAGSVEASAFHASKGGLFRSFEQDGSGKYRLHAHVTAGEIDLK